MLVFISWSGDRSRAIANEWQQMLGPVIQGVEVFWSPRIKAGRRQWDDLSAALAKSDLGIICVTPENKEKPWLMFEAGALSKTLPSSRVCTCLLELDPRDLQDGPLGQFQHNQANQDGVFRILETVNEALGAAALPLDTLTRLFTKFWPDFHKGLKTIPKKPRAKRAKRRLTEADKLNQILEMLQQQQQQPSKTTIGDFVRSPGSSPTVGTAISYPSPIGRDFSLWLGGFKVAIQRYRLNKDLDQFRRFNRDLITFVKNWDRVLPENLRLEILQMPRDFELLPEYEADGTINEVLGRLYAHAATIYDRLTQLR